MRSHTHHKPGKRSHFPTHRGPRRARAWPTRGRALPRLRSWAERSRIRPCGPRPRGWPGGGRSCGCGGVGVCVCMAGEHPWGGSVACINPSHPSAHVPEREAVVREALVAVPAALRHALRLRPAVRQGRVLLVMYRHQHGGKDHIDIPHNTVRRVRTGRGRPRNASSSRVRRGRPPKKCLRGTETATILRMGSCWCR